MVGPMAWVKRRLRAAGYEIRRLPDSTEPPIDADVDEATAATIRAVQPYTMTSPSRIIAVCSAVRHITAASVEGAIVECGVWRGGAMMAAARTLLEAGDTSRELWLYDTFTGMSEPTVDDVNWAGEVAAPRYEASKRGEVVEWCYADLADVTANLGSVGYPMELVRFVEGKVEDTIPRQAPEQIAVLRLDTDWYESTRHELEHLYDRVTPGGVLILDDYGYWAGHRKAVDEFLADRGLHLLLARTDMSGRIAVVP